MASRTDDLQVTKRSLSLERLQPHYLKQHIILMIYTDDPENDKAKNLKHPPFIKTSKSTPPSREVPKSRPRNLPSGKAHLKHSRS